MPDPQEKKRWQFVWWGWRRWRRFAWAVPYPFEGPNQGCIYSGMYAIGPFELRRWATDPKTSYLAALDLLRSKVGEEQ